MKVTLGEIFGAVRGIRHCTCASFARMEGTSNIGNCAFAPV